MSTGVLTGTSLSSFTASNFALLRPTLVPILGRTFFMGAGVHGAAHRATVSSFQMGRTPVTNEEYGRFVASLGPNRFALFANDPATGTLGVLALGPSEEEVRGAVMENAGAIIEAAGTGILGSIVKEKVQVFSDSLLTVHIEDHNPSARLDGPRKPVINVNWYEAFVYATLHGGTLPTEWQWEMAARVVHGTDKLRDYATPSGKLTHEEAHYGDESTQSPVDVDDPRYPTLENGLRHMTGNVWEWMQNWYDDYPRGDVVDPLGPLRGTSRSVRGGAWSDNVSRALHAADRVSHHPDYRSGRVGFRVAAASPRDFNK